MLLCSNELLVDGRCPHSNLANNLLLPLETICLKSFTGVDASGSPTRATAAKPAQRNQAETDSYCLDRRYVIPHQAAFNDPFLDQNVKTPKPKGDHRDTAESDHIGEDSSLHG